MLHNEAKAALAAAFFESFFEGPIKLSNWKKLKIENSN
jgi:hypothetical protein